MSNLSLDQLTAKTSPTTSDVLYLLDVEDTTTPPASAAGSSKSLTINNLATLLNSSTKVLTNTTFDTAGTGNVFKINGVAVSTVTGTGANVLATSPTLVTPTLGIATATSINGLTITTSTGTLTIANGKTATINNSLTFAGTDATTQTFQASDTIVGRGTTDTLTNKTLTSPTVNGPTMGQHWDGWMTASDTWTYASATTFTIAGVDRTAIFKKGTRLKFTNNAITVYATVISSSFSTNTTVTVATNSDFTINNSAITNPFYSYMNPPDYPSWFNFSSTPTWNSTPPGGTTTTVAQFNIVGSMLTYRFHQYNTVAGTTNTTFQINQPVAAAQASNYHDAPTGYASTSGAGTIPTNNMVMGVLGNTTINAAFPSASWECIWMSGSYPI